MKRNKISRPRSFPGTLELDDFDSKLLALVQENAQLSQAELGERVSLSTAAVNRRLKRLVEAGVVRRFSAVLSPALLGHPLTIIALVEAESERIDLLDALKRSFAACGQVQQCYYVTGEWDFVLVFIVSEMAEYTALTRKLFFQNNNVKRFKSLVSMDSLKVTLDVPLDVPLDQRANRTRSRTRAPLGPS